MMTTCNEMILQRSTQKNNDLMFLKISLHFTGKICGGTLSDTTAQSVLTKSFEWTEGIQRVVTSGLMAAMIQS